MILEAQQNPFFGDEGLVVPLVYRYGTEKSYTYLVIFLDVDKLEESLSRYSYVGTLVLLDQRGKQIFGPGLLPEELKPLAETSPTTDTYFETELQQNISIATMSVLAHSNWKIFAFKDENLVFSKIRELLAYISLVFFLVYVLEWIALYVIYRGITHPIEQLATIMENQRPATYTEEFEYPYDNEIGRLSNAYGRMMREIQEEELQIEWEQKQKRLAEIKALQAQINPHFLYNTLNSISWLAIDQHAEKSANLANLLASYYRTSLSKGEEFITVKEECEHVRNYLKIQQTRYKDMLTYRFDIPEKLFYYPIVKIVLQPLVENSIYHGIKQKQGPGHIDISAREIDENSWEISVEDNGIGIDARRLETINNYLRDGIFHSTTGYGIYNVNARIRLTYGPAYGLVLKSKEQSGTVSCLTLPLISEEGAKTDDDHHACR
jgi:two-component system sensor histidine kinase YesM